MATPQREFPMIGSATRPVQVHSVAELAACKSKTDAAYLALKHCGLDQETVADRVPMNAGHLSRLIRGRRPWNDRHQAAFERITGSFALTQWDCQARGAQFYADPVQVRKAILEAELADLKRAAG